MESNVHSYELTQKDKVYILTASVVGNDIKMSVKNKAESQAGFTRVFTIETWKKIGAVGLYSKHFRMLLMLFNG